MEPFLRELSTLTPCYISAYPNAGLPDAMGRYDQTPQMMATAVARFARRGIVNIVGVGGDQPGRLQPCVALHQTILPLLQRL